MTHRDEAIAEETERLGVPPARAIVLAAGRGTRLRPHTDDRPKCLIEIDGRTLIDRQIDALVECGVTDVVAVVGYRNEVVRRAMGRRVRYIENRRYAETNSLYSLWLAAEELRDGALVINSDVLAAPQLFERICRASAADAVLVDRDQECGVEEMRVTIRDGLVVDFGKNLPVDGCHGENVGVVKFGVDGARRLRENLTCLVELGHENDWAPFAFRELARTWPLHAIATDGCPWIEIDDSPDLERARRTIAPAILALEMAVRVR
jgi:L-glutamine-phosphate cytidylyltransferase